MQKTIKYIGLILLLAFILRIYAVADENIWYDESYTLLNLQPTLGETIDESVKYEPPIYYSMLFYWTEWFGKSEFSLRFPSVLFGVLSIFFIYLIVRRYSEDIGLLSAVIMSISPLDIYYSQEARMYSLFICMTLISFYFFMKFIEKERGIDYTFYLLFTMLSIYTSILAFISVLIQLIILIIYGKKWFMLTTTSMIGISLLGSGILINSIYLNLTQATYMFLERYSLPNYLWFFIISMFIILPFVIYHLLKNLKDVVIKPIYTIFVLTSMFIVELCLPKSFFLIRYTIFLYFIFYIILSINLLKYRYLFLVLLCFNLIILSNYYIVDNKQDWKGVTDFIEKNSNPDEIILFGGGKYSFDYYYKGNLTTIELISPEEYKVDKIKNIPTKKVWFITCREWLSRPYIDYLNITFEKRIGGVYIGFA